MNETVLIDFSWLWNRSLYAFKDLTTTEGISTGAIYGLLKFHEAIKNKGYRLVLCLDDFSDERKKLYEGYKANRETDEFRYNAKKSNGDLLRMLKFLGYEIYKNKGYEADDLIASMAMEKAKNNEPCIIFSSDKDLQQLMAFPTIRVSKGIDQGNFTFIDEKEVVEKIGVKPYLVRYYRPFKGDTSDNITSAVSRVPTKMLAPVAESIYKHLQSGNTLEESYSNAIRDNQDILTDSAYDKLVNGIDQYCLNFKLMDLLKHYHNPLVPQVQELGEPLTESEYLGLLDKYEMKEFKGLYLDTKVVMGAF